MRKGVLYFVAVVVLLGCRATGDELLSYGQYDTQAYYNAGKSHEATFLALWTAMNENYGVWDYEAEHGVDWDEVYNTYLPLFQALDDTTRQAPSRDSVKTLYSSFLDSLHDGHLTIQIKMQNWDYPISIQPGFSRVKRERGAEYALVNKYITNPTIYASLSGECHAEMLDSVDGPAMCRQFMHGILDRVIAQGEAYLAELEPYKNTEAIQKTWLEVEKMVNNAKFYRNTTSLQDLLNTDITGYNTFCNTYSALGPVIGVELVPVDESILKDHLGDVYVARFKGNIMYLRFEGFGWTPHLEPSMQTTDTTTLYYAYQQEVIRVWHLWFDAIQEYHSNGTLGGVIVDVRNNGGGYVNDSKFILGALLPSGGYTPCTLRTKNGIGRYDFGPLMPFQVLTYPDAHEVVDDRPVVVLANVRSVSMAENTSWSVKTMPNGTLMGTRTFGGLSALNTAPESYSETYSGAFGVQGVTAIWGYVPKYVALYDTEGDGKLQILEGIGITPDKEVPFDLGLYQITGRDNQLEAAIQFINQQ